MRDRRELRPCCRGAIELSPRRLSALDFSLPPRSTKPRHARHCSPLFFCSIFPPRHLSPRHDPPTTIHTTPTKASTFLQSSPTTPARNTTPLRDSTVRKLSHGWPARCVVAWSVLKEKALLRPGWHRKQRGAGSGGRKLETSAWPRSGHSQTGQQLDS